jgi:hypothetical protein
LNLDVVDHPLENVQTSKLGHDIGWNNCVAVITTIIAVLIIIMVVTTSHLELVRVGAVKPLEVRKLGLEPEHALESIVADSVETVVPCVVLKVLIRKLRLGLKVGLKVGLGGWLWSWLRSWLWSWLRLGVVEERGKVLHRIAVRGKALKAFTMRSVSDY